MAILIVAVFPSRLSRYSDMTHFPREVFEQGLAHVLENETEAAYRTVISLAFG
jgi:hypothetical protein